MTSIRKILAIMAALCLISCQKDDTLQYFNTTMGNFSDGKFISDQGNTFNIKELACQNVSDTIARAIIVCDVLSKTGEKEYDIRLHDVSGVFTKTPVDSTSVTDSTIFVENPLSIGEMWCSGGYINMFIYIPMKSGSTQAHLINLVRNDASAEEGVYEFVLKHNAYGEIMTGEDTDFVLGGTYVSFPVAGMFKEDKATIRIRWTAHKEVEGAWSVETERNVLEYSWKKGGFEHKTSDTVPRPSFSQGCHWM